MANRRIFTVGFELPSSDFEEVDFDSNQTLLDADIILFEPTLLGSTVLDSYRGLPILTESASTTVYHSVHHWKSEISAAVDAGKLVLVQAVTPITRYRYTGEVQFSGAGRSRTKTMGVVPISSYDAVPDVSAKPLTGAELRLEPNAYFFKPYWELVAPTTEYEVALEGKFTEVLLRTKVGDRVVGGVTFTKTGGALLVVPPLPITDNDNTYIVFLKQLAKVLYAMLDALQKGERTSAPPAWVADSMFRLERERAIEKLIAEATQRIADTQAHRSNLESELRQSGGLRRLLYEQGRSLENAVLEALQILGFHATPFHDGGSEFDSVFVNPDGRRCLGEAEGKDNKPINVDKSSQLERNLQEDFARDEVTEFAKGVLFGNAFRLKPLAEREGYFTEKCVSAAKRAHIALVRTPDLFPPVKYLKENPADVAYATACRDAIFATSGEIVKFPDPPQATDASAINEPSHLSKSVSG